MRGITLKFGVTDFGVIFVGTGNHGKQIADEHATENKNRIHKEIFVFTTGDVRRNAEWGRIKNKSYSFHILDSKQ